MSGDRSTVPTPAAVGIIVIGRNEGEHLRRSLAALARDGRSIALYVDSGSTDGSVELARSMGVEVHQLDPAKPFSPARGRREGAEILLNKEPGLEFIQFVDGDCELAADWLEVAEEYFAGHPETAILCGHLTEREPERSVYNWLSARQWERPVGEIKSCGGIFMIRSAVYQQVGGFDESLVTMEEEDLCNRVLAAEHKIVRLATPMAIHDSGLQRFSQWWQRAIWGGFGAGVQCGQNSSFGARCRSVIKQYLFWPVIVPCLAMAGLVGAIWWEWLLIFPLACLTAYALLFARLAIGRLRLGNSWRDALIYAVFMILRKLPVAIGVLLYLGRQDSKTKRPDPHSGNGG